MSRLVTIDCDYVQPALAAAYLLEHDGEVAFVEANTSKAVPRLLAALEQEGLRREQVRAVVVTHAHLDHAAGASALMAQCPNATLYAHPRAAKHLIDPSKLVASATQVYGAEAFDALYGVIEPISAHRVAPLDDGATLSVGQATLRVHHTRGHANHHFVVHDERLEVVFTGDTFGLTYPQLQGAGRFTFPSTSPTDFDGPLALKSVAKVVSLQPRTVAPTHFGTYAEVAEMAEQLRRWLERASALVDEGLRSGDELGTLEQRFRRRLRDEMERRAVERGLRLGPDDWKLLELDLELNAQGLAVAVTKARAQPVPTKS